MLKVLVINTVRFKLNGISAVIKNYYTAMNKDGLLMEFVAIDDPSPEYKAFFEENNLSCHVIYKSNLVSYFVNLINLCKDGKFDIVHVHGNSANMAIELLACWLGGVKVRFAHSHNASTLHPLAHKILYPLFTLLCTNRLACGEKAGKWLFHSKEFLELKNGIELEKYYFDEQVRKEYRKKLNVDNQIVIGHVGNFIKQKNHTFLLDWFAELVDRDSNYRLLLVSDGMLMEEMKAKAADLQIIDSVIFLGKTMEVQKYLQAMDIFVLPSLHEGLPVALVEAQAAGLPCIVSDRVTTEADLTGTLSFVPISMKDTWVSAVLSAKADVNCTQRSMLCRHNQEQISNKGYDIKKIACVLNDMYFNSAQKRV